MGAGKPGMLKPGMQPVGAKPGTSTGPFGTQPPQAGKPPIKLAGGVKPVQ